MDIIASGEVQVGGRAVSTHTPSGKYYVESIMHGNVLRCSPWREENVYRSLC